MANGKWVVQVGVNLSQKDIDASLKKLQAQLNKTTQTKVKFNGQEAIKQVQQYKNALGDLVQVQKILDNNGKTLDRQITKQSQSTTTVSTSTKKWINANKELVTEIKKLDSQGKTWITRIKETDNGLGQTSRTVTEYTGNNRRLSQTIETVDDKTKKLDEDVKHLDNDSKNLTTSQKSLAQSFVETVGKVAKFYLATIPIQAVQKAITESVTVIKEYDDAITEMKKVTDLSGQSLKEYTQTLSEFGSEVGRTTTVMTELATGFLKAGYDEDTASELAKIAA